MNVEIRHNGSDITDKIIKYTRSHNICDGIGTFTFDVPMDVAPTFDTWDTIVVREEGRKKGTFYISEYSTIADQATISVDCQDGSKRVEDYFIPETYFVDYASYSRYWIEKFLDEAGVTYNFNVSDNGSLLSNNTTMGRDSVMNTILPLLQYSGWYMYFDRDGTAQIGKLNLNTGIKKKFTHSTILEARRDQSDKSLRNRAVVWGGVDRRSNERYFAEVSVLTPYNYDSQDYRTIVIANSAINSSNAASGIASLLIEEFARLDDEKIISVAGAPNIEIGDTVRINSNVWTGVGFVSGVEVNMSANGLITTLYLDQKCPRMFGYFSYNGFVYIGTRKHGVWRKPMEANYWMNFSSGLGQHLNIKDLMVYDDLLVCVTQSGKAFYARPNGSWIEYSIPNMYDSINDYYISSDYVFATASTISRNSGNIFIGLQQTLGDNAWIVELDYNGTTKNTWHLTENGEAGMNLIDIDTRGNDVYATYTKEVSDLVNTDDNGHGWYFTQNEQDEHTRYRIYTAVGEITQPYIHTGKIYFGTNTLTQYISEVNLFKLDFTNPNFVTTTTNDVDLETTHKTSYSYPTYWDEDDNKFYFMAGPRGYSSPHRLYSYVWDLETNEVEELGSSEFPSGIGHFFSHGLYAVGKLAVMPKITNQTEHPQTSTLHVVIFDITNPDNIALHTFDTLDGLNVRLTVQGQSLSGIDSRDSKIIIRHYSTVTGTSESWGDPNCPYHDHPFYGDCDSNYYFQRATSEVRVLINGITGQVQSTVRSLWGGSFSTHWDELATGIPIYWTYLEYGCTNLTALGDIDVITDLPAKVLPAVQPYGTDEAVVYDYSEPAEMAGWSFDRINIFGQTIYCISQLGGGYSVPYVNPALGAYTHARRYPFITRMQGLSSEKFDVAPNRALPSSTGIIYTEDYAVQEVFVTGFSPYVDTDIAFFSNSYPNTFTDSKSAYKFLNKSDVNQTAGNAFSLQLDGTDLNLERFTINGSSERDYEYTIGSLNISGQQQVIVFDAGENFLYTIKRRPPSLFQTEYQYVLELYEFGDFEETQTIQRHTAVKGEGTGELTVIDTTSYGHKLEICEPYTLVTYSLWPSGMQDDGLRIFTDSYFTKVPDIVPAGEYGIEDIRYYNAGITPSGILFSGTGYTLDVAINKTIYQSTTDPATEWTEYISVSGEIGGITALETTRYENPVSYFYAISGSVLASGVINPSGEGAFNFFQRLTGDLGFISHNYNLPQSKVTVIRVDDGV